MTICWGVRAAALIGVPERGGDEPDWRGDVEIKTVPGYAPFRNYPALADVFAKLTGRGLDA